jgi:hypothetical protein
VSGAYQPLAATVHLEAASSDDLRALEVWEELRPVVEPLALTLLVGAFDAETGVRADLDPDLSVWQLIERGLPERIEIDEPDVSALRRAEVDELGRLELTRWLEEALAQPAPEPGAVVGLASLHCDFVRARLGDAQSDDSYRLVHPDAVLELPLEHDNARAYVLAPSDGLHFLPPVGWTVKRSDGWLRADVTVNWLPWLDLGRPEGAGVRGAAERLRDRGWQLIEPAFPLELIP